VRHESCTLRIRWVESNYDTGLLHSNLAFPLLKKLAELGNITAKYKFKEEIVKRIKSTNQSVIDYLYEMKYTSYLTKEELFHGILTTEDALIMEKIFQITNSNYSIISDFRQLEYGRSDENLRISIANGRVKELEVLLDWGRPVLPRILSGLKQLKNLRLYISEITEKVPIFNAKIKTLEILEICSWANIDLPDSFFKFPNLKQLTLSLFISNDTLESIGNLEFLEFLKLNNTKLKRLPNSIDKFYQKQ